MTQCRYIVVWRKAPPDSILKWGHHPCLDIDEAKQVVKNITAQGVKQYRTYALGDKVDDLSSAY